jgi:hypothetical protein
MSDDEALATIADRQASVRTITAQCDLDLIDAQGQQVRLEGALAAQPPERLRLRAWKFGQAVFDLTLADGKVWVLVPEEGPTAGRMDVEKMPARQVGDALRLLGPEYFRAARPIGGDKNTLIVQGAPLDQREVRCEIDRKSLTPRRYVVAGGSNPSNSELKLDDYTMAGGLPWPRRMRLRSPSGDVLIRIHELEINGEVQPGAFRPPSRARVLP